MKLMPMVLTAFFTVASLLHVAPSLVKAEEEEHAQYNKNLMQIIEDYVVANEGWERGSFYMKPNPSAGEGGFSVIKKNRPRNLGIGGNEYSFLIMVDLKTGKIIGTFAYQ